MNQVDGIDLIQPAVANIGTTSATLPAPKLDHLDRGRLLTAATRARQAYPGPVGELVADHLTAWSEFGFRLGGDSRIGKVVDYVMRLPIE